MIDQKRRQRILQKFDNVGRLMTLTPPRYCPVDTKPPRGRRLFTIPLRFRRLFDHIVKARGALNGYPAEPAPGCLTYYQNSERIEKAMRELEVKLWRLARVSDNAIIEYHSEWRYRVLRPRPFKRRVLLVRARIREDEGSNGSGLSYEYLSRPVDYWHLQLVSRA